MEQETRLLQEDFNPTFLFLWKGIRIKDEENYHNHEFLELCYVQSGRGRMHIDGIIYDVEEGDVVILNPGARHQALTHAAGVPMAEFYFGLTDLHLGNMQPNFFPWKDNSPVFHTTGELRLHLNKLCVMMEAEKETCQCGRYYMMKTYAMQFLLYLMRELEQPRNDYSHGHYSFESVERKYLVKKIIDYFEEHYSEKISLEQVAGNMYLSTFYVSKIFKTETGSAPIHYLIEIRLEKAKELLLSDSTLSIQEIAAKVGYDDAYHFSKVFKKKFGVSPSVLRKQAGKDG